MDLVSVTGSKLRLVETDISMILNRMRRLKWKMLAMPRANPRRMHSTPSLLDNRQPLIDISSLSDEFCVRDTRSTAVVLIAITEWSAEREVFLHALRMM